MLFRRTASRFLVPLTLVLAIVVGRGATAAPVTDLVFIIDATGSMTGEIAGVRAGFAAFVNDLNAAGVDARFAIVLFGGAPELVLDFTSDAVATQVALNSIVIGALGGFQNNHNANPEAGLEAIRMVLGAAPNSNLDNNNIPEDGILNFRPGARINLILATDEDSDRPFHAANRFAGQSTSEPPGAIAGTGWQDEVDAAAQAVINNEAFINLLVNRNDNPTILQYGDSIHDVSDADFSNFDAVATLLNLQGAGLGNSLEAQVLNAGLIGRAFDIAGANNPSFIANFFAAKVQEIVDDPGVNGIPEPTTVLLFGLGIAGLALTARRRRRKAA